MRKIIKILLLLPLALQADFIVSSYQELKNQQVVRQNYEESCGAASLATLINLIDAQKLSELDPLQTISQKELYTDMLSFADLEVAAKKLGFDNNSFRLDRRVLEKIINIPILVKIEDDPRFPHFVVIINHKGDYLQIFDPSQGRYISSKREFHSLWDKNDKGGYALVLAPKQDLQSFELILPKKLDFEKRVFNKF